MWRYKYTYIFLAFLSVGLLLRGTIFIVWEGEQALVTQFGQIIRRPITDAGIHFKLPLIQIVEVHDKRFLSWSGVSEQIPTGDQRYISVSSAAQWRIADLAIFIQAVQTVPVARARLDSIINGAVRDTVSSYELAEAVRIDNSLFESETILADVARDNLVRSALRDDKELSTVLRQVVVGREALEKSAFDRAAKEAGQLGIEIGALNFKQLKYQESVEHTVYERMISERRRVAEKIRAIGRSEEARIRGRLAKDYQDIIAPAHREAEVIKGAADAEATHLYATAVGAEGDFFTFLRTMDAYKRGVANKNGELFVSSNTSFFKALKMNLER
jgi:membrane protease subunit HflC